MPADITYQDAHQALRNTTGVVIPVYFPEGADPEFARRMLADTVFAFQQEVDDPRAICLSVDGHGAAERVARGIAEDSDARVIASQVNRGKLATVRDGMHLLLENASLKYLAIVDQDGDHFANELRSFVRAARHVERTAKTDRVMVLGRRISRHRPMGFLRGELEELADRMLLDALYYDAAITGQPLRMEYATTLEEFPDFHSGYKLFTRATTEAIFLAEHEAAGLSEDARSRHAVEAILSVEAIKSGAFIAIVNRSTFDEQPVSAFALLDRRRMMADKIIWPCKRLGAPGHFVEQWLRNHLPRLQLGTLVPAGRDELLDIRRMVLAAFDIAPTDDARILRPDFI